MMRLASSSSVLGVSLALLGAVACGGGGTAVVLPDGGDAPGVDGATPPDTIGDRASPTSPDAGSDVADAMPPADAALEAGGDAALEGGVDRPADAGIDTAPPKADAAMDLPAEKPPASASWRIAPGPACTAAGVGCMDTGAVGGYQVTASGVCGAASSVQLWFPGGNASIATGTYTVKVASGILDVINMQAGMVGVLAERDEGSTHARYWGRAGTVTVAAAGAGRRIMLFGVTLREETSGATTTLAIDGTCP